MLNTLLTLVLETLTICFVLFVGLCLYIVAS